MLRITFLSLLIFFKCIAFAQLVVENNTFNYGHIELFNNDTAFFDLQNNSSKTIYLLPTEPKENIQVLCNSKSIAPGESMKIGIVYYTSKKGNFKETIPLYFSHQAQPITLTIIGNIKKINETALNTCPSIENSKPLINRVPLSVIVKDKETNVVLDHCSVEVQRKKQTFNCLSASNLNYYICNVEYGNLQFTASKEGYIPQTVPYNYNADNNFCIIYLEKPEFKPKQKDSIIIIEQTSTTEKIEETKPYTPVVYKIDSGFNSTQYKPNHLIFVIDVSGSMRDSTKLNYLIKSIKELVSVLRPNDYISLITYASRPKLLLEKVNGSNKQQVYTILDSLKAFGHSLGSDALFTAYSLAKQHFIEGGNNQLFLASDGLFNGSKFNEKELQKMVEKEYNNNQIKLTTIGFGRDVTALQFLEQLSKKGRGQFITIKVMPADKDLLIEEVKKQSLIEN